MKVNKLLPIAAIFGCYVFASAAIAQQVCPAGGGACVTRPGPAPASSYSNARSVDIMIRQPAPVIPTAQSLLPEILPLLPTPRGTLTTGILSGTLFDHPLHNGYHVVYFCVAGKGIDLGTIVRGFNDFQPACPTGSGAILLSMTAPAAG